MEYDGLNISDFVIRKEIIRGCLLNVKKKMYKLKHFPDKDFTGSMHRMAKPGKRSAVPWAKAALLLGDHLKRVDGRLKRPAGTCIAEDQEPRRQLLQAGRFGLRIGASTQGWIASDVRRGQAFLMQDVSVS